MNAKKTKKIVVLATGGTIAGLTDDLSAPYNYQAGQVEVNALMTDVNTGGIDWVSEQLAQVDSKDMSFALWQQLLERTQYWLDQDDVQGIVITHGTDTVEETAYFLQTVLSPNKPVAITCAMLPANAPDSDGPANLEEAMSWVQRSNVFGVALVCAGHAHPGDAVQKLHSQQRNPFVTVLPATQHLPWGIPSVEDVLSVRAWPRVEIVLNHAGADGRLVRALCAHDAPDGWVVAGTGNGTVHHDLETALRDAQAHGMRVVRASRCAMGGVQSRKGDVFEHGGSLTPVQARVALMLELIKEKAAQ